MTQRGTKPLPAEAANGTPPSTRGALRSTRKIMSSAAGQIAQAALRPDVTIDQLTRLAMADAAFALQLLSLVNSPGFGRMHRIADIRQAASLLGVAGVRNVALSLLLSGLCPPKQEGQVLMANSLRRAVVCRMLAREVGHRELESAFATGLFLDSGLFMHAQDNVLVAAEIARTPAESRIVTERTRCLVPHPERGAQLAQSFELPRETVSAIVDHHAETAPRASLSLLAWVTEGLASVFESHELELTRERALLKGKAVGLGSAQTDRLLHSIPQAVDEVAKAFQRDVGEQVDLDTLRSRAREALAKQASR